MDDQPDVVSVERVIAAAPEAIFELLVDPRRHRDIDGSGSVRDAHGEPQRLRLGSRFGMSMKIGIPYSMVSTVVEYDDNRRIAWQTRGPTPSGASWPVASGATSSSSVDGGTLVRESWDIRQESPLTKPPGASGGGRHPHEHGRDLARIEELLTA
ncbi:MAG: SRPBCC family protein [Acidimicrobiales bacterium]